VGALKDGAREAITQMKYRDNGRINGWYGLLEHYCPEEVAGKRPAEAHILVQGHFAGSLLARADFYPSNEKMKFEKKELFYQWKLETGTIRKCAEMPRKFDY
jgi:hypothetical protein